MPPKMKSGFGSHGNLGKEGCMEDCEGHSENAAWFKKMEKLLELS